MNDLVVTLETAKKLKVAGWEAPTWFHYDGPSGGPILQEEPFYSVDGFNAPTAQEIADQLLKRGLTIGRTIGKNGWYAKFNPVEYASAATIAEALAALWLKLQEGR